MTKRKVRSYTAEFKKEAVALVTEQGYSVSKAAASLGITDKLPYLRLRINSGYRVNYPAFYGIIEFTLVKKTVSAEYL